MWQACWNQIPTTNILKEIKNNINKLSTHSNIPCRLDIVTTRSRIAHTNLTHVDTKMWEIYLNFVQILIFEIFKYTQINFFKLLYC